MTQASLRFQQLVNHFWHQVDVILNSQRFQHYSHRVEASKGWLLGLLLLLVLWLWNWQLVLSGGMGLAALLLVYLVQQGQWRLPPVNWSALWKPSNRGLTLALLSGAIVCPSTYLTLAIWRESGGSWLAVGMILQGFGILAIGLLLLWQRVEHALDKAAQGDRSFDQWLNDLSESDPLKRLLAVQRLTQQITQPWKAALPDRIHPVPPLSAAELATCFRLMLDRETEPIVCRVLLSSLKTLTPQQTRSLQPGQSLPFSAEAKTQAETKASLKN